MVNIKGSERPEKWPQVPVAPAIGETEAGGTLEPRS
jgi:hypothetical protein